MSKAITCDQITHALNLAIEGSTVEPRPYLRTIAEKTLQMIFGQYQNVTGMVEPAAQSVLIESPTGSGKTVIAHVIAKAIQHLAPNAYFGWVAMRRNLLTQAAAENHQHHLNVEDISYISMFEKSPDAIMHAKQQGRPIIMFVDECQHDAATSMMHLHNMICPTKIIGLTATPFRTDNIKLCFDKVVRDAGIHQLIQAGYLSKFRHYSMLKWTPESVAETYMSDPAQWGQSVVFFHQWEDVLKFRDILNDNKDAIIGRIRDERPDLPLKDRLVAAVKGGGSKYDFETRDEILASFRHGNTGVLVNCMVLTEGFDAPTLETAFVRDSCRGPTMQMAGRAFRMNPKWKDGGDERFRLKNVVQSKSTTWPITKTAAPEEQYVMHTDGWRSLKVNHRIDELSDLMIQEVVSQPTELPKFLLDKKKRARSLRIRPQ